MVLRKSEYRKNFKWIPTEKRRDLWLENARYRSDRRLREFGHVGWETEDEDPGDSESEECGLPPSKTRQLRLRLADQRRHQAERSFPRSPVSSRSSWSQDPGKNQSFLLEESHA